MMGTDCEEAVRCGFEVIEFSLISSTAPHLISPQQRDAGECIAPANRPCPIPMSEDHR